MMHKRIDEIRKRHDAVDQDEIDAWCDDRDSTAIHAHHDRATLLDTIESAEEIMVDAVRHLSRAQMGQDNNELAARMQEWLTEFAG